MTTIIYRIKRCDGLFSTGGMDPDFHEHGKLWTNIGHVKNHLNLFRDKGWTVYEDCVLVSYELSETEHDTHSLQSVIETQAKLWKQREKEQALSDAERRVKRELTELALLQVKYCGAKKHVD